MTHRDIKGGPAVDVMECYAATWWLQWKLTEKSLASNQIQFISNACSLFVQNVKLLSSLTLQENLTEDIRLADWI